jgi:hypothetical protein
MTIERKILIVLGVIILALAVFGFNEVEKYDYSNKGGPGYGMAVNAPAYEYSVNQFGGGMQPGFGNKGGYNSLEDQLNMMGSQGWELVSVQGGTYIFMRPVAQWR